jgi:hypothetical protein
MQTGLPDSFAARLDDMGFSINVDLKAVSHEDWSNAGFKLLEWQCVLKAHKVYRSKMKL